MRVTLALYLGALCLVGQGCAPLVRSARTTLVQPLIYSRVLNEAIDCKHDRELAEAAFAEYAGKHPEKATSPDFECGFKEGYADFLYAGGTGAPPPVPPRHYWNSKYETVEGHQAIESWFAGFRAGAEAARASGYRKLVVLPSSTVLPSMLPQTPQVAPPAAVPGGATTVPHPEEVLPPPKRLPGPDAPAPEILPAPPPAPAGPGSGPVLPPPAPVPGSANLPTTSPTPGAVMASRRDVDQLMDVLRGSWDPSQREHAAERLGRPDLRSRPELLEALTTAARSDPSALVRSACRRALAGAGVPAPVEAPPPADDEPAEPAEPAAEESPGVRVGTATEE